MIIVTDSMILIHLAKITLLETTCNHFHKTIIPEKIYKETVITGKQKKHPDATLIQEIILKKKIKIEKIKNTKLIKKANQYNIQHGEAEALALYWEKKADLLATDDDNVRKKKHLLNLNTIGTPAIILTLYQNKKIDKPKLKKTLDQLQEIGWYSNAIIDQIRQKGGIK